MTGRPSPVVALALLALLGVVVSLPVESLAEGPEVSKGMSALKRAAKANKYLFVFFWKENDDHCKSMYRVFQTATGKMTERAEAVHINLGRSVEKPIVAKFGVAGAPLPLVLAVAPNGAVTRGFPRKFDEKQLQQAFVSPCTEKCLKAMQQRKLVLLCVQNQKTQFSQVALRGAQDFKADVRFASATEILTLDPADKAEYALLTDLRISPQTSTAVTVVLAPPGAPLATFAGAVTKDEIVAKVTAAQSGPCAGGQCGPGGCCPPPK